MELPWYCTWYLNSTEKQATINCSRNDGYMSVNHQTCSNGTHPRYDRLANRAPLHWYKNLALHLCNQWNSLVNSRAPSWNLPALLPSKLPVPQVLELPEMVNSIQAANLGEPSTGCNHDVPAGLEATAPVGFPLEEITGAEGICPELKDSTKVAGRRSWPEGEFLHEVVGASAEEWDELLLILAVLGLPGELGLRRVVSGIYFVNKMIYSRSRKPYSPDTPKCAQTYLHHQCTSSSSPPNGPHSPCPGQF